MKMTETVWERSSLQKEVRRIHFSDVQKTDLPELYAILKTLFADRGNCRLSVCIGSYDGWFENEKEYNAFLFGFLIAAQVEKDSKFLDELS